jgi:hypothetical protein
MMCCFAEPPQDEPASATATACCAAESDDQCCESAPSGDAKPDSNRPSSDSRGFICVWCCCCPLRPIRVPEPPQARVIERSSDERIKVRADTRICRLEAKETAPAQRVRSTFAIPVPSDARQAILCVWRE